MSPKRSFALLLIPENNALPPYGDVPGVASEAQESMMVCLIHRLISNACSTYCLAQK